MAVKILFAVAFQLLYVTSFAQTKLAGKAVRILDGDTFELLVNDQDKYKIRLTNIDAPEKGQDFGQVSKRTLASLLEDQLVEVNCKARDRNQRILGDVYVGTQNINLIMVEKAVI